MLTPGDRRRIESLRERCERLRRGIEEARQRSRAARPEVDRFEAALGRLRARKPVVIEHPETLPPMRFVPETGRFVRDESR